MKLKRKCASCTACCTFLMIASEPGFSTRLDSGEDLAKPAGIPCRFLTPQGCGIYEVRPVVCRRFACDWLLGKPGFPLEEPPSQTRVISVRGNTFICQPIVEPGAA